MVRPRNEIEDSLFSLTKNCDTVVDQTHTNPQEALEYKPTKSSETFSLKPSINLGFNSNWMVGSTS